MQQWLLEHLTEEAAGKPWPTWTTVGSLATTCWAISVEEPHPCVGPSTLTRSQVESIRRAAKRLTSEGLVECEVLWAGIKTGRSFRQRVEQDDDFQIIEGPRADYCENRRSLCVRIMPTAEQREAEAEQRHRIRVEREQQWAKVRLPRMRRPVPKQRQALT